MEGEFEMSRKYTAVLLALVLTLQTAAGAAAEEVTEDIMQETEALAVLDASEYPAEEDVLPADESAEEVEIVTIEDDSEDLLPEADEIIEADPAEEELLEIQGIPEEEESALELIEEDESTLVTASDDEEPTGDFYEQYGVYYYNVAPGASLTLEHPSGLPDGAYDLSWIKYVVDPHLDEDGDLMDETKVSLGETSSRLQLDNIQEAAAYKLSWRTSEGNYDDVMFRVRVKNDFRTYSAQANCACELDENEQFTLSIDARAADADGMQFVWFRCEMGGEYGFTNYQKLDATGSSYTVTTPTRASRYMCYVLDKYRNNEQYDFFVSRKNLIYNGQQTIQVVLNKGDTYTMVNPITTADGTDDQLTYEWIKWPETLEVTSSSYTPAQIEDGDRYLLKVTDHYGSFYDLYWEFTVLEDGAGLELRYNDYYHVPYGSGLSIEVFAASGDMATPITYQWYDSTYNYETDSNDLTLRPGDTDSVLELQNLQESGGYACVVTQGDHSDTAEIYVSVDSKLKVDMPENANSAFVVVPDSAGNATLTVNASTDRDSLEYTWSKEGPGYATVAEGVSSITVSEPGYYDCWVDDGISSEEVHFLVGYPTAGIENMASAPVLSSQSPLLITHALNSMVYVKVEEAGEIGFRSVSDCTVTLLDAAGNTIDDTYSFGDSFYYDPEESGSPVYLAITTEYQDGLDDPMTLVWCTPHGSVDDSDWGPWYMVSEATCSFPAIMRRDYLLEDGAYEETYSGNPLGHMFGPAVVTAAPTVFAAGKAERTCARCGAVITEELPKLSAHLALNASGTVPLQVKKSSSAIEAVTMADGDYLLSAESSNAKIGLKVGVSGNKVTVKAGTKTGSSVITVRTAGGATATFKVKVQKAKVVAKKAVGFPKKLTLVKGQSYPLNPVITPVTTPDKLKYSSSDKKVAAVSKTGVIQARKKGKAVISLKVGKKTFKCKVTVH